MNILLFGATGMVGRGVLRECLLDPEVRLVQTVGRAITGVKNEKLRETASSDLKLWAKDERQLTGFHACFFCLGVSSAGMTEADYARVTYDLTLGVAEPLARANPEMTFVYVSGSGTDSTEKGRVMWARVKGQTENALLRLPFKAAYMFRPGVIQPLHGIQSKTRLYRLIYTVTKPILPVLRVCLPGLIITTEQTGRAMLLVAKRGAPKRILESKDLTALARGKSIG